MWKKIVAAIITIASGYSFGWLIKSIEDTPTYNEGWALGFLLVIFVASLTYFCTEFE